MFNLFSSQESKMRSNAGNWLEVAEKVYHYRRDVLTPALVGELITCMGSLRQSLKDRADSAKLKLGIEALEDVLRRTGGRIYPKSSLVENVEFFLVAAIVILGIRTYFVQPFKIPTNSMWPSYNGMTGEVFRTPADEPGFIAQGFRFITELAKPRRLDAPADGEVMIVFEARADRHGAFYRDVPGRKWLLIPTQLREYQLVVSGQPVPVRVPADFDLDKVLLEAFFPGQESYPSGRSVNGQLGLLRTGKQVKKGERILSFDVMTGDQLFVDRMSYHFVRPKVGDGFVFRTINLSELHPMMGGPTDQYYIKRLVGVPGDRLEIRDHVLLRNGAPIEGAGAFEKNAQRLEGFPGYRNMGRYVFHGEMAIPAGRYAAFGDNSASSLDSRYWGTIPAKDVVGRPLFIYYPFTRRWGPAP